MKKNIWPFIAFFIVTAVFFFRFLDGAEVFAFKDLSRYFYPLRHLMVDQVRSGHLPLWNPYVFCGMPLLATLQTCFFYPLSIIYYLLPFDLAFNYYIVIHYFLAACFMYLLMKHYKASNVSAFFSGIIFAFSGYLLSVANMNTSLSSVIWLPLVILFWDKAINPPPLILPLDKGEMSRRDSGGVLNFGFLISVLSLMFLGGEPTIIYMTLWLMLFYGLSFSKDYFKVIKTLIIAGLITIGVVSIQFIPFAELVLHSDRTTLTQFSLVSMRSLPPREIVNFILPFFYGNLLRPGSYVESILGNHNQDWLISTYIGFIPLMFAFIGILNKGGKSKFYLASAAFSILMAFGSYTPLYHLLYCITPGISMIRFPVKYLFIAFFSVSILSGFGFEYVKQKFQDKKWLFNASIILGAAFILLSFGYFALIKGQSRIMLYYYTKHKSLPPFIIEQILLNIKFNLVSFSNLCLVVFLSAFSFYAAYKGFLRKSFFFLLIIGVCLLDLFSVNSSLNFPCDKSVYEKITPNIKLLAADPGIFRFYYSPSFEAFNRMVYGVDFDKGLIESKDRLVANKMMPYKLSDFYGYESILLSDYRNYAVSSWKDLLSKDRRVLDSLNIKYIIEKNPLDFPNLKLLNRTEYFFGRAYLHENLEYLPRAFAADSPDFISGKGINASAAKILEYKDQSLKVRTSSKKPAYLLLSDTYYPGWKATVDGKEAEIKKARPIFRAVKIPAGEHIVRFYYDPFSLKLGALVSLIAISGLIFFMIKKGRRN
ncbi:YfhO family protein [Candidatus Saganbacteria bacterium]|nr:YfhO family protein [Candidatus Saganbacteria bacterium]